MKHVMTPEFRMQALCNDEATGEFFFRVVFRNVDGPSRILPPLVETQPLQCDRQGSLAAWRQHVAEPARMSSRLAFAICLGLAAPLLRRTELHSFGVFVAGLSKTGKSTMQIAGGSVIGLSTEDELPSFDITEAGFSELLAGSNDFLVPLNENGLMPGTAAECTVRLRRMAYVIAQGSGTTYSTRANMSKHGAGRERRCIVLASGEESTTWPKSSAMCRMIWSS
jgi:uncharacterized protein (DUF927 family)